MKKEKKNKYNRCNIMKQCLWNNALFKIVLYIIYKKGNITLYFATHFAYIW